MQRNSTSLWKCRVTLLSTHRSHFHNIDFWGKKIFRNMTVNTQLTLCIPKLSSPWCIVRVSGILEPLTYQLLSRISTAPDERNSWRARFSGGVVNVNLPRNVMGNAVEVFSACSNNKADTLLGYQLLYAVISHSDNPHRNLMQVLSVSDDGYWCDQ